MITLFELDQSEWDTWLEGRPQVIKDMADKYPPNILYRLKTTNQFVVLVSYNEKGTVTVDVLRLFNPNILFERQVFGIAIDDLERAEHDPRSNPPTTEGRPGLAES